MSEQEGKHYYIISPEDVRAVLEHRNNWATISQKDKAGPEWLSAGYLSWSKTGKTLRIMISDKPRTKR